MGRSKDFFIEIGTEEMPVDYIKPALSQLSNTICEELGSKELEYGKVSTFATPRRLVVKIDNLEDSTSAGKETIKGPPEEIAYDESGAPTKAAKGFARKFKVKVDELEKCETEKGEYICVEKRIPSKKTSSILSAKLPEIIKKLHFPKRMRWDDSYISYARPIRWICSLLGNDTVDVKVGNVSSNKYTYVRNKGEILKIEVSNIDFYFKKLRKTGVIVDHRKRKQYIKSEIEKICSEYNGHLVKFQEKLLEEVNFLVEKPCVFVGEFNEEFIVLPREVLLASMSKYQRVFGVENEEGKLISKFIGVVDGKPGDLKSVKENYKSVLESRLQDSLFFYQKDNSSKMEEKVEELKDVIYHKKLGSMYDKVERVKKLCEYLAPQSFFEKNGLKSLKRAAFLCKADLVTYMVNEFPSLQGVMGKIYALDDGEEPEIAEAIWEHYLPRFSGDKLPQKKISTILSVADRIDTLTGYFGIGFLPSGSYDPYGLRRDAYAVVRIMINGNVRGKLDELVQKSIQLFNVEFEEEHKNIKNKLLDFIIDKYKSLLSDKYSAPKLVDSVLGIDGFDIPETYQKFKQLFNIREKEYFLKAAKVSERTKKIFKNEDNVRKEVDEELFEEELEYELWEIYNNIKGKLNKLIKQKEYKEATKVYANTFYKTIDDFFEEVLVNVKDEDIRENRLALCKKVYQLYNTNMAKLDLLENIEV